MSADREPTAVEVARDATLSILSDFDTVMNAKFEAHYIAEKVIAALKAAGFVVATRDEIRAMSPTDLAELIKDRDDVTFEWGDINGTWRFVAHRPIEMP